jgi:autotransporter passenger strand-loop-strand repeat protein
VSIVEAGGTASSTTVNGGLDLMTTQFVNSGEVSSGVVVTSGNTLEVLSGGTADATTVLNAGTLKVDLGGLADPTTIFSGGTELVSAGGTDLGASISGA